MTQNENNVKRQMISLKALRLILSEDLRSVKESE
jgi:hypothetical protein